MIIKVESYNFDSKAIRIKVRDKNTYGDTYEVSVQDVDDTIRELRRIRLMLIGAQVGASADLVATMKVEDEAAEKNIRNIIIGQVQP